MTTEVAIIGSGTIGTDLMIRIARLSTFVEVAAMMGIDPVPTASPVPGGSLWPRPHRVSVG